MLRISKIEAFVRTCSASKFSAFTVITPLFGVLPSYFIPHEPLIPKVGCRGASGDWGSLPREPAESDGPQYHRRIADGP
jgi:hypothetical protein